MSDLDKLLGPEPIQDGDIYYVPFERPIVQAVDALVAFAKAKEAGKIVEREADWEVMEKIFSLWSTMFPHEYESFAEAQKLTRAHQKNALGTAREGEAMIQHQLNIPKSLYGLIVAIYPLQQFDKKFVAQLAKRMPILKAADKI